MTEGSVSAKVQKKTYTYILT